MLRQLLAVDKVMKSARDPAMDTQSATCMSPGTAEFMISKLIFFNTPPQTSSIMFFSWVSADAVEQHLYLNHV